MNTAGHNSEWLPSYCDPNSFLPKIQETRTLFNRPPFLFSDFIGRAIAFLQTETVRKMGFHYDPKTALPCKWKCSDESLFGVDLAMYSFTGQFPFDKGKIGGYLNTASIEAAVHHGKMNIDFGGSHVGYVPGPKGGKFGSIWRPLKQELGTDCGHLCNVISPFRKIYKDACKGIKIYRSGIEPPIISIPNEFLHPDWCSHSIKLMIYLPTLTAGWVQYDENLPHTHTPIGRTLFYLNTEFLENLPRKVAEELVTPEPTPIGRMLTVPYYNIYDTNAEVGEDGMPEQKMLPYMKYILSAKNSPSTLKAAIVNTNLEYNRLTDAVRSPNYKECSFASFTGVFIDLFCEKRNNYVNLFQPLGISIKPAGTNRECELTPDEIYQYFESQTPVEPVYSVGSVISTEDSEDLLNQFTYAPGKFQRT
jgi:hypothetical protein